MGFNSGFKGLNRVNFRQECDALYSDQLNAEPAHSATAAEQATLYAIQRCGASALRRADDIICCTVTLRHSLCTTQLGGEKSLVEMYSKWLSLKYTESI